MQRMETKDYSAKETKGEQGGVDEVGGEQRRSVSFIAHSRPLREGLMSQGLRGSGLPVGPHYLLQPKPTTHRRRPLFVCCVRSPCTSLARPHEASRGPMASAQSLLTHARRMDADYLPEHLADARSIE